MGRDRPRRARRGTLRTVLLERRLRARLDRWRCLRRSGLVDSALGEGGEGKAAFLGHPDVMGRARRAAERK